MKNPYFEDEIRYLREVGPEFARVNPEVARFLGETGTDPDVERILEGVAFLCGRIRQKLDDELPELTANMMSLLWPHYLRPVPSMSVLELLPDIDGMQAPLQVRAGAEFASQPVEGTRCIYRACWPTLVRPWSLRDVRLETAAAEPVRLIFRIQASPKVKLAKLDAGSIRLHLCGDPRTTFSLYLLLAAHVEEVTVGDGTPKRTLAIGPRAVAPAGLDRSEAVLPYPHHSFVGYRLLQEYFAFKERFLFFDVKGVDRAIQKLELEQSFEVAITFNRRLESYPLVARENLRLHCVPIINLFSHDAEPLRIRHDRTQYLIQPSKSGLADRRHAEIFSVDRVKGLVRSEGLEAREYPAFYSFSHMTGGDARKATYYQTHLAPSLLSSGRSVGTETYISFVVGGEVGKIPEEETVSIDLTCTNRDLPAEIRANEITEPTDSSPPGVRFRNIIKPTATIPPPLGKQLHWRLISHMSLNYVSLTDTQHFKELLRVYEFQSAHDAQRMNAFQRLLDGIVSVKSQFAERLVRGTPIRGVQVDVELHEDHFAGEGDAFLFATLLDRFVGLYVTLNSYSQLNVRFAKSGQPHSFPPRWGEQHTPADAGSSGDGHG